MKYTFGEEHFGTQGEVKVRLASLRRPGVRYTPGTPGFAFLRDLYGRHPVLLGRTLAAVGFDDHTAHRFSGAPGASVLEDTEGVNHPFLSYKYGLRLTNSDLEKGEEHCRKKWKTLNETNVWDKMRMMIQYQVDGVDRSDCAICVFASGEEVDHAAPNTFKALSRTWAADTFGEVLPMCHEIIQDDCVENSRPHFIDPETHLSWLQYHEQHAVLRALCIPCHKNQRRTS